MKIEKSCEPAKTTRTPSQVANGTVFRYGVQSEGPYLKLPGGVVDLQRNLFFSDSTVGTFTDYKELPAAKLVTGE